MRSADSALHHPPALDHTQRDPLAGYPAAYDELLTNIFVYGGAIFALPESLFIDYSGAKYARFALPVLWAQLP